MIPGQVDPDLWNEHFARYAFAARLARGRRVLEVACGAGYGSAELAHLARHVTATDVAEEAVEYAREHYQLPNLTFETAPATALPYPDASFDLVVAFEVIEHLTDHRALLSEARRLLAPGGQLVVSTPNRVYYEETRRLSGPNPFHTHEFDYREFHAELSAFFPHVAFFLQNHTEAIVFQPAGDATATEVRAESAHSDPESAHFFLAVCAASTQTGAPRYVYLPSTSNVLREREQHIAKLEQELAAKSEWLEKSLREHEALVRQHGELKNELEERNRWAEGLNRELRDTTSRVAELQDELASEQTAARQTVQEYEAKIEELDTDIRSKVAWAQQLEARLMGELNAKSEELARCVSILHRAENDLEERTRWAQSLDARIQDLSSNVSAVRASRWFKLGRTLGLGPEIRES